MTLANGLIVKHAAGHKQLAALRTESDGLICGTDGDRHRELPPCCAGLVALTTALNVPADVGVPPMRPLAGYSPSPRRQTRLPRNSRVNLSRWI